MTTRPKRIPTLIPSPDAPAPTIGESDIKYISALPEVNLLLYLDEIQRQLERTQRKSLTISTLAGLLV